MSEKINDLKDRIIFLEKIIELNNETIEKYSETNKLLMEQLKKSRGSSEI